MKFDLNYEKTDRLKDLERIFDQFSLSRPAKSLGNNSESSNKNTLEFESIFILFENCDIVDETYNLESLQTDYLSTIEGLSSIEACDKENKQIDFQGFIFLLCKISRQRNIQPIRLVHALLNAPTNFDECFKLSKTFNLISKTLISGKEDKDSIEKNGQVSTSKIKILANNECDSYVENLENLIKKLEDRLSDESLNNKKKNEIENLRTFIQIFNKKSIQSDSNSLLFEHICKYFKEKL